MSNSSSCIESARTPSSRYPYIGVDGKVFREHRYVWTLTHGQIPAGLVVCHTCDNPRCVNVEHLFLGTQADNLRDMDAKGRRVSMNTKKTECPHGHGPYDAVVSGRRACMECARQRKRAHRARQKVAA